MHMRSRRAHSMLGACLWLRLLVVVVVIVAGSPVFFFSSPLGTSPNLLALGTKDSGASGFDDYGGELEIMNLDFKEPGLKCPVAGKVRDKYF